MISKIFIPKGLRPNIFQIKGLVAIFLFKMRKPGLAGAFFDSYFYYSGAG